MTNNEWLLFNYPKNLMVKVIKDIKSSEDAQNYVVRSDLNTDKGEVVVELLELMDSPGLFGCPRHGRSAQDPMCGGRGWDSHPLRYIDGPFHYCRACILSHLEKYGYHR